MKRKKRKNSKKTVSQDCENSVMIEDQWIEWSGMSVNVGIPMKAEKLSNTELKIDFESLREYWFDKFAWSWPSIIGFYILVASIFKMLIFFELFLQTFVVTLVLSIVGFYKLSRINDYLIIDQNDRMIYKVAETAKQSTKSKYLAFDDIKQIGIDSIWKKNSDNSNSCHYQIIALTQSKKLIPLSEWVDEKFGEEEFTENLSKFMQVEYKKPPYTEEGSKLYRKGGELIYRDNTDFFGPYWLSNIIGFSLIAFFITASLYGLIFVADYNNPNTQELAGNIVFALVMLLSSIYALVKYFVFKKLFR